MRFQFLSRLAVSPTLRRAARAYKDAWKLFYFWPLPALRKSRFAKLGVDRREPLGVAEINLASECKCRHTSHYVPLTRETIRQLTASNGDTSTARLFGATAAVSELDTFADFDAWRVQVSRATSGKYHRSANKARRMGYSARVVGFNSCHRSVYELTGSKFRRSKGLPVWAALIAPPATLVDTKKPPVAPVCPEHWRYCWGAFKTTGAGEKLVASAILVRAGNTVWIQRFIGHGDALKDGVTKLLIFDIMQWLLARAEPGTQGIRYLLHGSIEEGDDGLFDWKRYLGFKPMLLDSAHAS